MLIRRNFRTWFTGFCVTLLVPFGAIAEQGDDNPTGVAGAFNGQITTGNDYDPYTGNMRRQIDDIVVPGSIGAYPLKWSRFWNSHTNWRDGNFNGARWRFSYVDYRMTTGWPLTVPDGREVGGGYGVEEEVGAISATDVQNIYGITDTHVYSRLRQPDGGEVLLQGIYNSANQAYYFHPVRVRDPYGQITVLSWTDISGGAPKFRLDRVTEPGGRFLQITWDAANAHIVRVEAYNGVDSQPRQWVTYHWIPGVAANEIPQPQDVIDVVNYSDGTSAHYTYGDGAYQGAPTCTTPGSSEADHAPLLSRADDPHFAGPMRQIAYTYQTNTHNRTRIASENHAILLSGQLAAGEPVSSVSGDNDHVSLVTETRGDGATRTFSYNGVKRCRDCPLPGEGVECRNEPMPLDGKLMTFTDFLGHTTSLSYETDDTKDSAGFITGVTDANGHTTQYVREGASWGIDQIIYPDGSQIEQTFTDDSHPYFLASRTLPHGPGDQVRTIVYTRNASTSATNPNVITRKDYPHDADEPASYETFTYNSFGEVLSHRLTSGGTESFTYDSHGLKQSWTDAAGGLTTYTYYTGNDVGGAWTDRLKTVTHPANASGFQATETYEYDYAFDSNGNQTTTPAGGRGLVTKITYADNTTQSGTASVTKVYNKYGDLLSATDELGHTTTFSYDDYGRLLTTTDALNHTTRNDYTPTGGQGTSYVTTSKQPFATILPSGKQTTFEYDLNWRKTAMHQAPNTADAATTRYVYDQGSTRTDGSGNIGLLTSTIDPRNNSTTYTYDLRDRQISVTDPLGHTSTVHFNQRGQKDQESHANGELIEYMQYDAMNRLRWQRVHREAGILDDSFSTYDAAGNLDTHTDEDGNIYNYDYDALNRPTQLQYPNAKTEVHTYDAAGNIQTYKNRADKTQAFSYDKRNRQTDFTWSDGTTHQSTTYDAASRKRQIVNDDATINFQYQDDNRLQSQEESVTASGVGDNVHRTVTYHYDADGNRDSITYPSGTKFAYDYTQRNQVADIKLDGALTPIVSYQFDSAGNIMHRTLDNNTSTAYTVDAANRDTSISHALTAGPKRFDYAYNSVNDITVVQRDLGHGDKYEYDLTQEIKRFAQNGNVDLNNGTITSPQADTTHDL